MGAENNGWNNGWSAGRDSGPLVPTLAKLAVKLDEEIRILMQNTTMAQTQLFHISTTRPSNSRTNKRTTQNSVCCMSH